MEKSLRAAAGAAAGFSIGVGLALLLAVFLASCATRGRVARLEARATGLEAASARSSERADATDARTAALEAAVEASGDRAEATEVRLDSLEASVSRLESGQVALTGHLETLTKEELRTRKGLERLERSVALLRSLPQRVNALQSRASVLEEVLADKEVGKGFQSSQVGPFGGASADLNSAIVGQLEALAVRLKKEGKEVKRIVGYADPRPFRRMGRLAPSGNNNVSLASLRAGRVAEALYDKGVISDPDLPVEAGGATERHGLAHNANRVVFVVYGPKQGP